MKPSIWNILSIVLLAGVVLTVIIFGVIFLLPNQVLPAAFRPVSVPPTLVLPTSTETPPQFPPTWTKSPIPPTVEPTKAPTGTLIPSETMYVLPSKSPTTTASVTYTPSVTNTKASGVIIIVNGTVRTATKTLKPTKTPTKKPTITPGGDPLFAAIDDYAEMGPAPASIRINILANDFHFDGLPIRIVNFTKFPKHGNVEKVSSTDVIYKPNAGFIGLDSFEYKMTDEPGSTDFGMVYITVTDGSLDSPNGITLSADTVNENQPAGLTVGTFSTTDPSDNTPFIYKFVIGDGSTNNNLFTISGDTLKTTTTFNAESTPSLSIRVRSTDSTGLFFEKKFIITVASVNEAPTITTVTAPQGIAGNAYTGTVRAIDPDTGDTLTFTCPSAPTWLSCVTNPDKSATLSGTPGDGDTGLVSFTITVSDGSLTDIKNVSFNVIAPSPTRTPSPIPGG